MHFQHIKRQNYKNTCAEKASNSPNTVNTHVQGAKDTMH
jgi:hypothetical protein